jgi:hypothetical protein
MRTDCVQVVLTFALLCAPPVTPQITEDGSRVQAEMPADMKRPTRTGQAAQPAPGQTAVERPAYGIQNYSPLAAAGGYKRQQQTFWEFWWHQFNPRNINYGAWIEQRRRVFLEQAGENRYFWFSFWAFATICFLLLWAAKERMDRKDTEWEAAECLADLANYADYCKRHAFEAIQKHNEHIEACNRVIESAETGQPMTARGAGNEQQWAAELDKLRTEIAQKIADNAKLIADLEQKTATVTDLSARVDELARNQSDKTNAAGANPNLDLVARMNRLTTENQALREENGRLKRANQNVGSGERVR